MLLLSIGGFLVICALLTVVSFVQSLYLESMRIRARELPAQVFFRETLEDKIGEQTEHGMLAFSLLKHTLLFLVGIVALALTSRHGPMWQALLEAFALASAAMLIFSYMIPQILYRRSGARWALALLPFFRLLILVARPVVMLILFLESLAELGDQTPQAKDEPTSAEHIEALITAGEEEGIIEEGDRKLIQSVVAFGDKTVREVMTARPNIVGIDQEATLEELRQLVIHEQYSRIPVFDRSIDRIVGFVHVRDMFELEPEEQATRKVKELIRPVRFVPETKPVTALLREMQEDGTHMAAVIDEYGNTAGIATLEDMVEEIVGEIRDEHEPASDVQREPDGAIVVSGSYDLDHLEELMSYRPQGETESTTVGGLVTEWLGRVPSAGERVCRNGLSIEVLAGNDRRVEQVRISRFQTGEGLASNGK